MKSFEEILQNIEGEIKTLREINQSLISENAMLRRQLHMPLETEICNYAITDVFNKDNAYFDMDEDSNSLKSRTCSAMCRQFWGKYIDDFNENSIVDLLKIWQCGVNSCAIIIVVLEHYGVNIRIPNIAKNKELSQKIENVIRLLPKYRKKITFKK